MPGYATAQINLRKKLGAAVTSMPWIAYYGMHQAGTLQRSASYCIEHPATPNLNERVASMKNLLAGLCTAALILAAAAPVAVAHEGESDRRNRGSVFVASNSAAGNKVLVYQPGANGSLAAAGEVATGGLGSGGGLGNQGGVAATDNGKTLLVVNAGSNDVSVFSVRNSGLTLTDRLHAGGVTPVSIGVHDDIVYVLNAGSDNISGFRLKHNKLTPIAGSTVPLSGAGTAPAQIAFNPAGDVLLVTEKATNKIVAYTVNRHGVASGPVVQTSNGATPFGFAFDRRGHALVSEAFGGTASALSSYQVSGNGVIRSVSHSIDATGQKAACWVVVTRNGKFAYITNTASGTLSSYAIDRDGSLRLIASVAATTGAGPIDMDLSKDSQTLFVLNAGSHSLQSFEVDTSSGHLTPLETLSGVPASANGLVAQ
jgi:6-phosphogluconolactonase